MGWAYCGEHDGREIGYGIEAQCDGKDCETEIDRGLGYCCGTMHGGENGCGGYFCEECKESHPCEDRDAYWDRLTSKVQEKVT